MEKYCLDNEIFGKYMNEKLMDITDMLLEAQENGVPVENVIGSDKKTYAENMFSDMSIGKVFGDMTYYLTFFAWMFLLIGAVQRPRPPFLFCSLNQPENLFNCIGKIFFCIFFVHCLTESRHASKNREKCINAM